MSETLAIGTSNIEVLGNLFETNMGDYWQADDAFYDLLRDRAMINAMLSEIGGKAVADGNVTSTAKVQKQIIRDHVEGNGSRKKVEDWLPRFMHFPMRSYTKRSGLNAMAHWQGIEKLFKQF
jgi:ParB family chromosome partitioning protein